jgi:phage FluMu protein Com
MCLRARLAIKLECPHDHRPIRLDDVIPIVFKHRKIFKLRVRCHVAPSLCGASNEIGANESFWRAHDRVCEFRNVPCENHCGEMLARRDLPLHLHHSCPMRLIQCAACGQRDVVASKIDEHQLVCPRQLEINRVGTELEALQTHTQTLIGDIRGTAAALSESEAERHRHAAHVSETLLQMDEERKADASRAANELEEAERRRLVDTQRVEGLILKQAADVQALRTATQATATALDKSDVERATELVRVETLFRQLEAARSDEALRLDERLLAADQERIAGRERAAEATRLAERRMMDQLKAQSELSAQSLRDASQRGAEALERAQERLQTAIQESRETTDAALAEQDQQRKRDAETAKQNIHSVDEALQQANAARIVDNQRMEAMLKRQEEEQQQEATEMRADIKATADSLKVSIAERRADAERFAASIAESEQSRLQDAERLSTALRATEVDRFVMLNFSSMFCISIFAAFSLSTLERQKH